MKIIYHSKDLDGYCSGAICKYKYPEAELWGYDYGQPFPFDDFIGHDVIMIDVSLPMKDMLRLAVTCQWLTWVDHHISAITDYKALNPTEPGYESWTAILENGIAACEVGWKYFFPDTPMPTSVKLLGEYDTWRNADKERWDNAIMPFQYGMRMICNSAETFPLDFLNEYYPLITDDPTYKVIHDGKLILDYQKTQNERACRSSFSIEFEGLRAICLNAGGVSSTTFDSVWDEQKYDIMIPFVFTGRHWTVSLYTTKKDIDCSAIAKRYGGGGHRQASGFQIPELPDEFKAHHWLTKIDNP